MATPEGAQAAIQALAGKELQGRALTVNEARPREDGAPVAVAAAAAADSAVSSHAVNRLFTSLAASAARLVLFHRRLIRWKIVTLPDGF